MLTVTTLKVIMLTVTTLKVIMLTVTTLKVIMLTVTTLKVIMLTVTSLKVIMLTVTTLKVIMLTVTSLKVIMLTVTSHIDSNLLSVKYQNMKKITVKFLKFLIMQPFYKDAGISVENCKMNSLHKIGISFPICPQFTIL
jgi:hypothetical protein